jgi:hypothetical protein
MSRDTEIARLYAEGILTLDQIGARYGLSKQKVSLIARNLGATRSQWHSVNGRAASSVGTRYSAGTAEVSSSKKRGREARSR